MRVMQNFLDIELYLPLCVTEILSDLQWEFEARTRCHNVAIGIRQRNGRLPERY